MKIDIVSQIKTNNKGILGESSEKDKCLFTEIFNNNFT
jgi:hypothetical protein